MLRPSLRTSVRQHLTTQYMDNDDYPRSMMPDMLCCWVFQLPPTLDYAVSYVWDIAVT
jgi:hypothetical protein